MSATEKTPTIAIAAHVVPFVAWLLLMTVFGEPAAWKYALRAVICLGLFLALRPWRWYPRLSPRNVLPAVVVGIVVFVVWIAGETDAVGRWPALRDLYLRVGLMPPWRMPEPMGATPYAPEVCGWGLTLARIAGSTLVIALIEEFFWRGCLYRILINREFLSVKLDTLHVGVFVLTALAFGLEHTRWLAGVFAGCAYGALLLRTRDVWAAGIAHAVTNLLLGVYVVATGSYPFWG